MKYNRLLSLPPLFVALLVMLFMLGSFPTSAQVQPNPTPTTPPRDLDGDGVFDVNDLCPTVPGPAENNGCPLPTAVPDSDRDGVLDNVDLCPTVPGPAENNGCPLDPTSIPDTDGDSVVDTNDLCPTVPGSPANRGCPLDPTGIPDTDGDSVVDTDDLCPTVAGTPDNRGCPPDDLIAAPTAVPDTGSGVIITPTTVQLITPTSIVPPANLPTDGCFVTPKNDTVNVREKPDLTAPVLGQLYYGKVYESHGVVTVGAAKWLVLTEYENSVNIFGYTLATTLNYSGTCPLLSYPLTGLSDGIDWFINQEAGEVSETENPTIEYCVNQEVEEAGVFKEVCYEVEIPEGCVVTSNEAGVFTVDCGEGEVSVNPLFDNLPDEGLAVPVRDSEIGVLQIMVYTQPATNTSTIEHCMNGATAERGKFKLVCYEVEVPEGCWLVSAEAGVFKIQCRPEIGGEASFTVEQREDTGVGVIVRHSLPAQPTLLMPTFRDCNQDGIGDINGCNFEFAADDGDTETNKETEGWWREVLDLTCPGDWIIMLETDEDGDEVVTDAQCVDDIE
jgi:hypothetical protein